MIDAAKLRAAGGGRGLRVAGAICIGSGALVLRRVVVGRPDAALLFAAGIVALGVVSASLDLPAIPERRRLAIPLVLLAGLAAMGIAASRGPAFPAACGPWTLAFAVGAAIAEEAFFRRVVYGGLLRFGALGAVGGSALLFAGVHVPLYGPGVFWVDLGAGLLFGWQRWASAGWASSAATHAVANVLAVLR